MPQKRKNGINSLHINIDDIVAELSAATGLPDELHDELVEQFVGFLKQDAAKAGIRVVEDE